MSHRSFSGAYSRFALSVGTVAQAKAWMSAFETIRPPVRAGQSACAAAVSNQAEGGWADVLVDSMGGAVNQVLDCFLKGQIQRSTKEFGRCLVKFVYLDHAL